MLRRQFLKLLTAFALLPSLKIRDCFKKTQSTSVCPVCGSHDLTLNNRGRIMSFRCNACECEGQPALTIDVQQWTG